MKNELMEILSELRNNSDIEKVYSDLESIHFKDSLLKILDGDTSQDDILDLYVLILQYLYNNTDLPNIITDEQYDVIYERFKNLFDTNIIGSTIATDRKTATHLYPDLRGTLDKVYWFSKLDAKDNRTTLCNWMYSLYNNYGIPFDTGVEVYLLPKWDGVSLIFECDDKGVCSRALTRGDVITNKAVDLSEFFKGICFGPISEGQAYGLKTECVVSDSALLNLANTFKVFASKRNAVSGLINNKNISKKVLLDNITIKPLQYQTSGSPNISDKMFEDIYEKINLSFSNVDTMSNIFNKFKERISETGYDFDGVVLRIIDKNLQDKIGRKDHINKYEVAFKFPAPEVITTLEDVDFQIGLLGAITPVAHIKPTRINSKEVSRASLGSIQRLKTLNLHKGDSIVLKYDIIPYVDPYKDNGGDAIIVPTHCPFCKSKLTEEPVLGCYNKDCDITKMGKILNYCVKMNISNISEKRIFILYQKGILRSIKDLYSLYTKCDEITSIDGMGEKIFNTMIDSVGSKMKPYDYEVLGALGIRGIGRKIFKKISSIYYINELQEICSNKNVDKLIMEGIQYDSALKIINGINDNKDIIDYLCSILSVKCIKDVRDVNDGSKVHVCFTKIRDKAFEAFLIEQGVVVVDSYSSKVNILICKDTTEKSAKLDKAVKQGKMVCSLKQAYKLFNFKK